MKRKILLFFIALLLTFSLAACGEDPQLTHFKKNVEDFCNKIVELDAAMNNIDASKTNAPDELLDCLDELDLVFQSFGRLDFPEEFDYLESIADEAVEYMKEAVKSYHEAYSNQSYNQYTAEYASQNYSRAYKRIKIIIEFLQGETPDDDELSIEYVQ